MRADKATDPAARTPKGAVVMAPLVDAPALELPGTPVVVAVAGELGVAEVAGALLALEAAGVEIGTEGLG